MREPKKTSKKAAAKQGIPPEPTPAPIRPLFRVHYFPATEFEETEAEKGAQVLHALRNLDAKGLVLEDLYYIGMILAKVVITAPADKLHTLTSIPDLVTQVENLIDFFIEIQTAAAA